MVYAMATSWKQWSAEGTRHSQKKLNQNRLQAIQNKQTKINNNKRDTKLFTKPCLAPLFPNKTLSFSDAVDWTAIMQPYSFTLHLVELYLRELEATEILWDSRHYNIWWVLVDSSNQKRPHTNFPAFPSGWRGRKEGLISAFFCFCFYKQMQNSSLTLF